MRAIAFLAVSAIGIVFLVASVVRAQSNSLGRTDRTQTYAGQEYDGVEVEHRFTQLEVGQIQQAESIKLLANQLDEIQKYIWIVLLGVAGLSGEAGLRLFGVRIGGGKDNKGGGNGGATN